MKDLGTKYIAASHLRMVTLISWFLCTVSLFTEKGEHRDTGPDKLTILLQMRPSHCEKQGFIPQ